MIVGKQLKELRNKAKLTLGDVHEKTGYAKSSIMSVEKDNDPHLSTVCKLAETYGKKVKITFE